MPSTIAVIAGTRPEAVKLSPVIAALREHGCCNVRFIATGQHRALFNQALGDGGPEPDLDLDLMQADQAPGTFLARAAHALAGAIGAASPALVIVQGDTASAYAGALAAFKVGVPLAHVEAGLRTASIDEPFPEELFRRAIGRLAAVHFAPTERARDALLNEGVRAAAIHVTGNTGIDHLRLALERPLTALAETLLAGLGEQRFGLATIHRRENRGERLAGIAGGLDRVARGFALPLILPLHPAPDLRPLQTAFAGHPLIRLTPPLDHATTVQLLARSALVLTDSGGLQEEAATLGTPAVVLRTETERAEAVEAGRAVLAGSDAGAIMAAAGAMLAHDRFPPSTLFGDGHAGEHIARIIAEWLER